MDQTQLFKATLMAIKLQRKVGDPEQDKQRILPKKKATVGTAPTERDEFAREAKEVSQKITSLRNVLLENRSAYMRIGQHLKSAAHMTDEQRDLIDNESEKFFTYYTLHLAQMRCNWKGAKRKPQQRQHDECVLDLLDSYLRNVQQIFLDQRKYRMQHELETYRLLKLAADKKQIPVRPAGAKKQPTVEEHKISDDDWDRGSSNHSSASSETDTSDGWQLEKQRRKKKQNTDKKPCSTKNDALNKAPTMTDSVGGSQYDAKTQSTQKFALDEDIQKSQQLAHEEEEAAAAASNELSPEDVQMFEQENVTLYQELQGLSEEVELIEKNVVDIAQLQDIFTEKVSLQQHNIERIANAVVGATENVKDANEQIRQAIQRNAGLRVWSLFFLLVMSFALLFLDWYYD